MKVFLLDLKYPYHAIKEADVEVRKCKKMVWAILPNGRRKLLGSSAFFTEGAALRAQIGALKKVTSFAYLSSLHPEFYHRSRAKLETLQTLH